ncbi:MAG: hypothetical protein U1F83_07715 [Verrucomicrobiota bacterium]
MSSQSDSDLRKEAADWLFNFPRLLDLYQHSDKRNPKNYFNVDFSMPLGNEESRLTRLDLASWKILRDKAAPLVSIDDSLRQHQFLWNVLDEASGYVFLADQGYERIEFIEPDKSKKGGKQSPDLVGYKNGSTAILEVKTINESRDNLAPDAPWRTEAVVVRPELSEEFKRKVIATIEGKGEAKDQLQSYPHPTDRKIVLLVVRFDYGQKTGGHLYMELESFIASQNMKHGIEVYHQVAL